MLGKKKLAVLMALVGLFLGVLLKLANCPANQPLSCCCFNSACLTLPIKVQLLKPGFEPVVNKFRQFFVEGKEIGASVSVYFRGEHVVQAFGGVANRLSGTVDEYDENTIQGIFSTNKVAEALVLAMLVDRGFLSYDERIAHYWPEFAQNGKENITVKQFLRHEAGLSVWLSDVPMTYELLHDEEKFSQVLAAFRHELRDDGEPRRQYHGITRGYFVSEIVKRVDPKHRNFRQFFREEVAEVAKIDIQTGITEEGPIAKMKDTPWWRLILCVIPSAFLPDRVVSLLYHTPCISGQTNKELLRKLFLSRGYTVRRLLQSSPKTDQPFNEKLFASKEWLRAPISSSSAVGTSDALARLAEVFRSGKIDNATLLSSDTLIKVKSNPSVMVDENILIRTTMVDGGLGVFPFEPPYETTGWLGYGGQACIFNEQLAFGFTTTLIGIGLRDERWIGLWNATVTAALDLKFKS